MATKDKEKSDIVVALTPRQSQAWLLLMDKKKDSKVMYGGAKGGGKMARLSSKIVTPFGISTMGEMRIGSQVSNPDGTVARVIAVHPQGVKDIYRVTFDDGASCEVGLEHLWCVRTVGHTRFRKRPVEDRPTPWKLAATQELMEGVKRGKRYLIPLTKPVEFTVPLARKETSLPLHPYFLGVVLGDGHIGDSQIGVTCADPGIIARLENLGYSPCRVDTREGNKAKGYFYSGHKDAIAFLGLTGMRAGTKFIPSQYLLAPVADRLELLRGLMDTDGYADKRGHASYCSISERLAKDVQWLAWSLGYKANITSKIPWYRYEGVRKQGQRAYNVWIKGDNQAQIFSLPRKAALAAAPWNNGLGSRTRKIVSIAFSCRDECQCITVDNPNGLYLTDDFIVTHNSFLFCWWVFEWSKYLTELFQLPPAPNPLPLGFIGRKQGIDFMKTTMESWKKFIPYQYYTVREQAKEIILFGGAAKIFYGGLDDRENINKFNSMELAFIGVDQAEETNRSDVDVLQASLRLTCNGVVPPYKELYTANPAECWLKQDFIDEKRPGYDYVPALPTDNPHLPMQYVQRLRDTFKYSPQLLSAYLEGDWKGVTGNYQLITSVMLSQLLGIKRHLPQVRRAIGCDPSLGGDECVTYVIENGTVVDEAILMGERDADKVAARIAGLAIRWRVEDIGIDSVGIGGEIIYALRRLLPKANIISISSAERSGNDKFGNKRTELWWNALELVQDKHVGYPEDEELRKQITAVKFKPPSAEGWIILEPKNKTKDQIGRSPDRADAWVYGLWALRNAPIVKAQGKWDDLQGRDCGVGTAVGSAMCA
jgi:hypothetical protein